MGCGVYWQQINEAEKALRSLQRLGLGPLSPAYQQVYQLRGSLLKRVGFKFPRTTTLIGKAVGLSPGEIKVWYDSEAGWMAEAREYPGAPPVYHYVSDEIAVKIIMDELTHEEFEELKVPDTSLDYSEL